MKTENQTFVRTLLILSILAVLLPACQSKEAIAGRWEFGDDADYDWMEFFEDGTYTDSWGNTRTYTVLSDGRLNLVSNFGGFTHLFGFKIKGNTIEMTDEDGITMIGTRIR